MKYTILKRKIYPFRTNWFIILEYVIILILLKEYVWVHWNKRETISFTDIFVLETFLFIFFDLYKTNKEKWKKKQST